MAPLTETGIEVVFTPESIDDDIRREGVLCMIEVLLCFRDKTVGTERMDFPRVGIDSIFPSALLEPSNNGRKSDRGRVSYPLRRT